MRRWWNALRQTGWLRSGRELSRRAFQEFRDDHCQQMAAAIAYHVLFSLFPLAIVTVGIVGMVTSTTEARNRLVNAIVKHVPVQGDQLHRVLINVSGASGALGLIGIVGVIWAASGMMSAIRTALNIAWDTDDRRPFVRGKLVDLALVGGSIALVGTALGLTVVTSIARRGSADLPHALHFLSPLTGAAAAGAAFVLAFSLLFVTFGFLYRVVPVVETRARHLWPGALTAAAGFEALQYGFAAYISHSQHYNQVYGSLGGIVAFLFFVYLASAVFLFGAEVASEYERMCAERAARERAQRTPERVADEEPADSPDFAQERRDAR
jgi:membrane protein